MKYTLRPRQEKAVEKMVDFVNSKAKKKAIFVYPTSFGKSIVIANVASKFPDRYFINVTNSKELLKQNYEKYISYGNEASLCSASLNSNDVSKVTFATIGTLIKHKEFFKGKDVVILDDECHSGSKVGSQLDKFLKYIKTGKLIGTTATPFRLANSQGGSILKMMNRDRDCIYTSIEDVVQIHEVVEEKGWSPLVYLTKDVDESSLVLNTTGSDYTLESIKKFNQDNEIVENCILEAESLILQGRKSILISVPFIEDALQIEQRLSGCKAVYSGMNDLDRDNIISDFKSLKIKVVVQVMILSIGFDHPMLDALILAKPTNSLTFYYQFIGRGVRIHPDKKDCLIVDISGNYNKFGKVEDITIEENDYTKGWASFSGDTLLTSYPLGNKLRPTKKSLIRALEREIEQKENKKLALDPEFFFGKYKGKKLSEVIKDRDGKYYLAWIVEPETNFTFYGEKGSILKKAIYDELKLDSEPDVKPKPIQVNKQTYFSGVVRTHKEIISDYTSKISVADLWDSN